ncbi:hypothetical protein [Sphingomonas bacterium]|uniref:hypothetical protein n=1 Tax=Sphingomonas bacterium TaxID=1895847 RepID=UPI00157668E2|nr:hypothetical protein [Sphingomonas bacterium]
MKLASFLRDGAASFGCVEGDEVLDFGPALAPGTTLRDCLPAGLPHWRALAAVHPDGKAAGGEIIVLAKDRRWQRFRAARMG